MHCMDAISNKISLSRMYGSPHVQFSAVCRKLGKSASVTWKRPAPCGTRDRCCRTATKALLLFVLAGAPHHQGDALKNTTSYFLLGVLSKQAGGKYCDATPLFSLARRKFI